MAIHHFDKPAQGTSCSLCAACTAGAPQKAHLLPELQAVTPSWLCRLWQGHVVNPQFWCRLWQGHMVNRQFLCRLGRAIG